MQGVGCRVATQRAEGLSAKRQSGGVRFAPSAAAGARRSAGDAPSTSGRPPVAWSHTSRSLRCQAAAATAESNGNGAVAVKPTSGVDKLRVIIAGGGIGGLLLAAGLLKRGYDVVVLERDLTSIKGEGKYRGPIQIQSNALGALEAVDEEVAERVCTEGCVTGDRINGLCDGITGDWYVKFDTYHPAVDNGLPVTRVIGRYTLQQILAEAVWKHGSQDTIVNGVHVVDYEHSTDPATGRRQVTAISEDGRRWTGDVLVGADGIRSKIRVKMVGEMQPTYSEYTCYTGIADFTPADIDTTAYRVFLGQNQYFVTSDVGEGKTQWYGFHCEPPGGDDEPGKRKERLLQIFGHWSDMVTDLIKSTPEEDVLRRDIYDRPPIAKWAQGRVVLLGDAAHAMQPNLGQGGCMAIEDACELLIDIDSAVNRALGHGAPAQSINMEMLLQGYFLKRVVRAASIHGMARMAAYMACTYKAYLGEGLGPLEVLTKLKIPHPGKVIGGAIMRLSMPGTLGRILGGYNGSLKRAGRVERCRLDDQPAGFSERLFPLFMTSDDALLRAANADWLLVPATPQEEERLRTGISISSHAGLTSGNGAAAHELHLEFAAAAKSAIISKAGLTVGTDPDACSLVLDSTTTSGAHAWLAQVEGDYYITDLGSRFGTWVNGRRISSQHPVRLLPGDLVRFGLGLGQDGTAYPGSIAMLFKVKMQHASIAEGVSHGEYNRHEYWRQQRAEQAEKGAHMPAAV